ncbi:transglutaminase-like domain-containing protein [Lachnoclostridium phytofermentans]|uniref:Transglutaminase domain protein n=1 Tax=Lachnoclostridium phytofermentans (strain ATCC 700394 / DSM 18823 / ISDg) TaxID=357809 RepID=A9KJE0_LACP7|nr:transglutaminase domain-containing protein [Lachnoclostridium phytofermentans]ABX42552.1 transglutaminase domain protein [Lachnoclostridium phytofermentans ISDg]
MFSVQLEKYANKKFEERKAVYEPILPELVEQFNQCGREERILLEFLYGTMPVRDAGEYEFKVFLSYVTHANWLREHMEWTRQLPEDYFIHYVFYPRVNSEDITECRQFFYDHLKDRIKDKNMTEAVLEINYWCAENATYEASDSRTISPMTVYNSGKGRCGEESTFAVTAFRSVGIAARQVYTPRWAHCDDNHAWVEIFVDGTWCFLGACEPEEVLNKGWFLNASSRALLVHSRTFSDYRSESTEEHIGKEDLLSYYNSTSTYAKTRCFKIFVKDKNLEPVCGAKVSLEILNYAEFASVTELYTDEKGCVSITIGLGDIHIRAVKDGFFAEAMGHVRTQEEITLILNDNLLSKDWVTDSWEMCEVEAPKDSVKYQFNLTREQQATNRSKLREAKLLRENRIESYYDEALAENVPDAKEILHLAKGNFMEIYRFLTVDGNNVDSNQDRLALLKTLKVKDYKDVTASVLEDHLKVRESSYKYRPVYKDNIAHEDSIVYKESIEFNDSCVYNDSIAYEYSFAMEYIVCPRIYLEELTAYRSYINSYFDEDTKQKFISNPNSIWDYIKEIIKFQKEFDYQTITATPIGCLKLQQGNTLSQKILFVAICRTLGIPARLNKVTMEPEFFDGKDFCILVNQNRDCLSLDQDKDKSIKSNGYDKMPHDLSLHEPERGNLILLVENKEKWTYGQNFTLGKLQEGQYLTLDYEGLKFPDKELSLLLEAGIYRLIVTTRMPNGNQHMSVRIFEIQSEEEKRIQMILRENQLEDLLVDNEIADFEISDGQMEYWLSGLMKEQNGILAFLDEGKEPTEHVLNEMLEKETELQKFHGNILFIVKDQEAITNETMKKVLEKIPNIQVYFDPELEHAEPVARRMYVDPEKLPLLVALNQGCTGVYSCAGYNVGSVALILKILDKINK